MLLATFTYLLTLPFANECSFTPEILVFSPFGEINNSNNLIRKTGSHQFAEGDAILVRGHVLDSHCNPVQGAMVDIWQEGAVAEEKDENFNYSGRAITNNLGEYFFLTVMPASTKKDDAPHINFQVRHAEHPTLSSAFYFENSSMEINNFDFTLLNEEEKSLLIAKEGDEKLDFVEQVFNFDITLHDYNFYKQF